MSQSHDAGHAAAETLRAHDVDTLFTLSGGHLFPLYDGCVKADIRLVDTRHEQTAAFAAEGWAKVTRRIGVAALTAGPGVTNGVSAITSAYLNGSPVCVIGGRAPHALVGLGAQHVHLVEDLAQRGHALGQRDLAGEVGELGIDAVGRAGRRVEQDEGVDALGVREHEAASDHPAHRVAEEREPLEVERVGDRERVGGEPVERVGGDVGGLVAGAVPAMVEEHHVGVLTEAGRVVGEILLGPGEAVHEEERRSGAAALDREPHPVVGEDRLGHWGATFPESSDDGTPGFSAP